MENMIVVMKRGEPAQIVENLEETTFCDEQPVAHGR